MNIVKQQNILAYLGYIKAFQPNIRLTHLPDTNTSLLPHLNMGNRKACINLCSKTMFLDLNQVYY